MILLKRRGFMTRAQFNYKIANGTRSVILKNCKKSLFKRFEIHGKSTQVTTTGAQLLDKSVITNINGNLTYFSIQVGDGKFTLSTMYIRSIQCDLFLLAGKKESGASSGINGVQAGSPRTVDSIDDYITIAVRTGVNKENPLDYETMLNRGETSLPYEPYTGGFPSPTREYRQEIFSCGRKGKNLFDITKAKSNMATIDVNIEESSITLPIGGAIYFNKFKDICPELKNGDEVYVFAKTTGERKYFLLYNPTVDHPLTGFGEKITITEAMLDSSFLLYSDPDKEVIVSNIMVTKENDDIYEPYSDKFLVDIEVTGKNLVPPKLDFIQFGNNDPKTIEFDPKTNSYKLIMRSDNFNQVSCHVRFDLKKGTYTIARKIRIDGIDIEKPAGLHIKEAGTKKDLYYQHTGTSRTFKLEDDKSVLINFGHYSNKKQSECVIYDIQLEKSDIATPYEPYHEPQIVQLELDEPLRGIGQYKDIITKKGVIRNVLEVEASENLIKDIWGDPGVRYTFVKTENADIRYDRTRCMSNVGFASNQNRKEYTPVPYDKEILIQVSDDDTYETVKEKLKNVKISYIVKTPVFEPFPPEVQRKMSNLYTNEETTIVSVDSGEVEADIEVEYTVKQQKLAYIHSTGTQYIDTLYKPNPKTVLEMDIQFVENENTFVVNNIEPNDNNFFGVAFSDNIFTANFGGQGGQYYQIYYWNNIPNGPGSIIYAQSYPNITDRSVMLIQNNKVDFLGITKELDPKTTNQDANMFLFGLNNIRAGKINKFKRYDLRLYGCKIYEDDVLMKDFIPAKLGNKIGLYDNVTKKFHENKGTGEFLYGTEVI